MSIDFNKIRMKKSGKESLGDMLRSGKVSKEVNPELFVRGPEEFDCLYDRWSRGEVLTILGASGIGKTEVVLYFLKEILKNNESGCCCFVSLEMTPQKIAIRFFAMLEEHEQHLADRFYVISNFDDEGKCKGMTTEMILKELDEYRAVTGDLIAWGLDHLHIVEKMKDQDINKIAQELKNIAVSTNSLCMALSQVPKGKAQKGDVPLEADAPFGCSQLKWIAAYTMQIHRPLIRIEHATGTNILCWSYPKIREQSEKDGVKVGQNKLIAYEPTKREFRPINAEESSMFSIWYEMVLEERKEEENDSSHAYDTSYIKVDNNGNEISVVGMCDIGKEFKEKKKEKSDEGYIKNEDKRVRRGYRSNSFK